MKLPRPVKSFSDEFSQALRWIDAYLADPRAYRVFPDVQPGDIAAALPKTAPEEPHDVDAIMRDFRDMIVPGITHWNSPRFFAYFATSAAPAGIAAEALSATLDVKAMLWRTSPAATELEEVVMRWLRELIGLPPEFTGIIYDTASIGGFTALAAARESLGLDIREHGMSGAPRLRVYITEHTHSHIEKACIALGVGTQNAVRVACDDEGRMRASELRLQIENDLARGYKPMAIVATAGTTSTTSVDPVTELAQVARESGVWLHVDAAYAGVAAMLPEMRWVLEGAGAADSVVVNPHKWLFVPMDLSALYVRDTALLARAFTLVPEYLRSSEQNVRNYMDYGLQLGRRFRALKLWFVLRYFGAQRLRQLLRGHIALAQEFAQWVRDEPAWEISAPHPFSVVCFRFAPDDVPDERCDVLNDRIMNGANATGQVFLSHTKIGGRVTLRLAIGNLQTNRDDVLTAWNTLREQALGFNLGPP